MEIKSSPKKLQPEIITPTSAVPSPLSFTEKHPDLFRLILVVACAILIATFIYWKKQQDLIRNVEDTNRTRALQMKLLEQMKKDNAENPPITESKSQAFINQMKEDNAATNTGSTKAIQNSLLNQMKADNAASL